MDADVELSAQLSGLQHCTCMAYVVYINTIFFYVCPRTDATIPWWKKSQQPSTQILPSRISGAASPGGPASSAFELLMMMVDCEEGGHREEPRTMDMTPLKISFP